MAQTIMAIIGTALILVCMMSSVHSAVYGYPNQQVQYVQPPMHSPQPQQYMPWFYPWFDFWEDFDMGW